LNPLEIGRQARRGRWLLLQRDATVWLMSDLASYKPAPLGRASGLFGAARWLIAAIALLYLLTDSYFIVQPTEMAGVRRLGHVITKEPLPPGIHFKVPFVDQADKLQVSIDTFR